MLGADVLEYSQMSHVGPLLSTRAGDVAADVVGWASEKLTGPAALTDKAK